jgi:hypothetical protein
MQHMKTGELPAELGETWTLEFVALFLHSILSNTHPREQQECMVFQALLQVVPGLEDCLMMGSDEDIIHIADLVCLFLFISLQAHCAQIQKDASSAQADDTKRLKGAILV